MKSKNMNHRTPYVINSCRTIYDRGPAMFPGITIAQNGDFILTFCTAPDGLPGGKVCIIRSPNNGNSWSFPEVIACSSEPDGSALNSVGITTLRDGTIILPYNDIQLHGSYSDRTARLFILRSVDNGFTWSEPIQIAADIYEPFTYGKIIELTNGTLLLPIWGRYKKEEKWRAGVLISHDRGNTWDGYRTIAYDPNANLTGPYSHSEINGFDSNGKIDPTAPYHPDFRAHCPIDGYNETFLSKLPDGKIIAILRQQGIGGSDRLEFYRALSADNGETWSVAEQINLCGMSPCLHWSPRGRLILAYRQRFLEEYGDSEYGVALSWSEDYGRTWEGKLVLKDPKGFSYTAEYQSGYPTLVNIGNNKIMVIFYSYDPNLPFKRYLAANILIEE